MRRAVALGALLLAAACGGGGNTVDVDVKALTATDAWAPPSADGDVDGTVYLTIVSPVDTDLRQVEVSTDVASAASVQDADGAVQDLALPAGEAVTLEPGGNRIVLRNLVEPLSEGDRFDVLLVVERTDPLQVTVTVSATPPN
jgi:periplasmic copper chaperone A